MKTLDLTGQRFGQLVAGEATKHKGRTAYLCQCDCGATKVMRADVLQTGVKHCKIPGRHEVTVKVSDAFYGPLISRFLATEKGYKWYVSGQACKKGHLCERQTANGSCRLCGLEKNAARFKGWYEAGGRERVLVQAQEWAKANPDRRRAAQKRHTAKVLATPQGKIKRVCRRRVVNALMAQGVKKSQLTEALIGCSIEFMARHIEVQFAEEMNWENHGRETWHIDHVRPCESFDLQNPAERAICFNWRNQRPLTAAENMSKRDEWTPQMEADWVELMGGLGWKGDLALVFEPARMAA